MTPRRVPGQSQTQPSGRHLCSIRKGEVRSERGTDGALFFFSLLVFFLGSLGWIRGSGYHLMSVCAGRCRVSVLPTVCASAGSRASSHGLMASRRRPAPLFRCSSVLHLPSRRCSLLTTKVLPMPPTPPCVGCGPHTLCTASCASPSPSPSLSPILCHPVLLIFLPVSECRRAQRSLPRLLPQPNVTALPQRRSFPNDVFLPRPASGPCFPTLHCTPTPQAHAHAHAGGEQDAAMRGAQCAWRARGRADCTSPKVPHCRIRAESPPVPMIEVSRLRSRCCSARAACRTRPCMAIASQPSCSCSARKFRAAAAAARHI